MSDLTLRKQTLEALGWKVYDYETGDLVSTDAEFDKAFNNDGWYIPDWDPNREAHEFQIETDPGIAISELVKMESKGWQWRISSAKHRKGYTCGVWVDGTPTVFADGTIIAETICLAVIAASKGEG